MYLNNILKVKVCEMFRLAVKGIKEAFVGLSGNEVTGILHQVLEWVE